MGTAAVTWPGDEDDHSPPNSAEFMRSRTSEATPLPLLHAIMTGTPFTFLCYGGFI